MIRKCFTVNAMRQIDEINSYEEHLIKTNLYSGCEIFYPYNVTEEQYNNYVKGVKSYLKYDNFEITCHLPYGKDNNIASNDNIDMVMDRLYKAIDFSTMFNVNKVTLHPGHVENEEDRNICFMRSINNVKKLAKYASKYNITIMIENLVGANELCLTKEEMLNYLSYLDEFGVKVTFDCGHLHASHVVNKTAINDFIYSLKDYISHLHLSDNHGERDEHAKIGTGTINFVEYFNTLKEIDYQGLYSSEVLFKNYNDLIDTSNTIDKIMKEVK